MHYEWSTTLLEQTSSYIFVLGEYGRKLKHHTKRKTFEMNNWTIEFFPFDSWFTVSADVNNGVITQYYCNINEPATLAGDTVSFIDLDLDLLQRNGEWFVVDEAEFEHNALLFSYPEELKNRVRRELTNLQNRIQNHQFPFDGSLDRFIERIPNE
jgi:uncharacterized protein